MPPGTDRAREALVLAAQTPGTRSGKATTGHETQGARSMSVFVREIHDSIYLADVYLVVCSFDDFKGWLKRHQEFEYTQEEIDALTNCGGKQIHVEGRNGLNWWIVWFPHWYNTPAARQALVHESIHLAVSILNNRGMGELGDRTEEAYTYYAAAWYRMLETELLKRHESGKTRRCKRR